MLGLPLFIVAVALFVGALIGIATLPVIHLKEFCAGCGYSRIGLPAGADCPECGKPFGVEVHTSFRAVAKSRRHRTRLMVIPALIGIAGAAAILPTSSSSLGIVGLFVVLILGLGTAVPGVMIGGLAAGRTTTPSAWTVALAGSLPSAVLGGTGLIELSRMPWEYFGLPGLPIVAGVISTGLAGAVGVMIAVIQRRRIAQFFKRRAAPCARQAVEIGPSTRDPNEHR